MSDSSGSIYLDTGIFWFSRVTTTNYGCFKEMILLKTLKDETSIGERYTLGSSGTIFVVYARGKHVGLASLRLRTEGRLK